MERIALSLDNPNLGPFNIDVNTAYKPKSRKVRFVDLTDGTGEVPGGRKDWFERSKARETPQEHTGKYARYLLPRIVSILKGSRFTFERLTSLLVGDWLWESEREMFDEMMLNREGAIAFDWKEAAGTYRLINAAMKMNSVTLRDANIPPSVDEFSEEFAGCFCASLIDFFSGYD
ncbi:hypothetical protein BDZ45DRAFT_608835, partial [Acephala macrosclerotiorum]